MRVTVLAQTVRLLALTIAVLMGVACRAEIHAMILNTQPIPKTYANVSRISVAMIAKGSLIGIHAALQTHAQTNVRTIAWKIPIIRDALIGA